MLNITYLILLLPPLPTPAFSATVAIVHGSPVGATDPIHNSILVFPAPDGEAGCSGTLISPHVAVTAGHCVRGGFASPGRTAESIARAGDCAAVPVIDSAFAPGAQPDGILMNPDIALVRLKDTPCGAVPVALSPTGTLAAGDVVTAAGFGIGADDPKVPQEISLRILPQTKAAITAPYATESSDWQNMIANDFDEFASRYIFALPAVDYGTICGGDSGGPVFTSAGGKATLLGENSAYIVHPSLGIPSCDGAYLQLLTPLGPYLSWIHTQTAAWEK